MTLITIPTIRTRTANIKLTRPGERRLPTMSGPGPVIAPPFTYWLFSIQLGKERIETARAWFAAQAQLSKLSNSFKITPPGYFGPGTGYSGATPLVKGAGQLGLVLLADGVTPSTAIAKKGDFLTVNNEMKLLTADATSDGVGNVTFNFEPALRNAPTDNATINIQTPQVEMGFVNAVGEWDLDEKKRYLFTLYAMEVY